MKNIFKKNTKSSNKSNERKNLNKIEIKNNCKDYNFNLTEYGINRDHELEKEMFENNISQSQAEFVYKKIKEFTLPIYDELIKIKNLNIEKDLIKHFGSEKKWLDIKKLINLWAHANLEKDTIYKFSETSAGIKILYNLMLSSNNEHSLDNIGNSKTNLTEKELREMINNPKYWNEKNKKYIQKVKKGFQNLYS